MTIAPVGLVELPGALTLRRRPTVATFDDVRALASSETGSAQTHNVVATLPGQPGYSPLWAVLPYDNAEFAGVHDAASAAAARGFPLAGYVNCPIVFIQP